jgi:hypothetical protein
VPGSLFTEHNKFKTILQFNYFNNSTRITNMNTKNNRKPTHNNIEALETF